MPKQIEDKLKRRAAKLIQKGKLIKAKAGAYAYETTEKKEKKAA